jgi:hypothetical protein
VIIFGVALFGMITSYITARFLHRHDSRQDIDEMREELASIKSTLARIDERLVENQTTTDFISKNIDDWPILHHYAL